MNLFIYYKDGEDKKDLTQKMRKFEQRPPGSIPKDCRNHTADKECQWQKTCHFRHPKFGGSADPQTAGGSEPVGLDANAGGAQASVGEKSANPAGEPKVRVCWNQAENCGCKFKDTCKNSHIVIPFLFRAIGKFLSDVHPDLNVSSLAKYEGMPISELTMHDGRPILLFEQKGKLEVLYFKTAMEQALARITYKNEEKARQAAAPKGVSSETPKE